MQLNIYLIGVVTKYKRHFQINSFEQNVEYNNFFNFSNDIIYRTPGLVRLMNQQFRFIHDDVIKWKHFPRYWPFVRGINRSPVNSPHKGQWRGALMFSLICARINGWVNNGQAGDLRRYRVHCDVMVMWSVYMHHRTPVSSQMCSNVHHALTRMWFFLYICVLFCIYIALCIILHYLISRTLALG